MPKLRRIDLAIKRYHKEGRGKGIGKDYKPWLKVERSGLPSKGKSSILLYNGRQHHFFSKGEVSCFLLATMLADFLEAREQFPLNLEPSEHEILAYTEEKAEEFFPGTRQIAEELGIRHPRDPWVMSTDLLISFRIGTVIKFLAISYKPSLPTDKRKLDLLRIEKAYWEARGIKWLFITADLITRSFANQLQALRVFALDDNINLDYKLMQLMVSEMQSFKGSYAQFIQYFINLGHDNSLAKKAFWTGYWYGLIPLKITGRFNPCAPLEAMPPLEFLRMNPIFTESSAWK